LITSRLFVLSFTLSLVMVLGSLALPGSALAHEERQVGPYTFIVGFREEPAIVHQPNSIDLTIESAGQGIEGLHETLQAEVIVGGGAQKRDLPLEPSFGEPGRYESWFIPTVAGDYTFHVFGEIAGQAIDETFDSGPETFSPVEVLSELQFPEIVPTNNELASQIGGLEMTAPIPPSSWP